MSILVIEVCKIEKIEDHPNADRLKVATVKGWKTCIGYDPMRGADFAVGETVIYIPPDAVLPAKLANGPDDEVPGRLNVANYLAKLPKDKDGNRPEGGRVKATRLRGQQSFGFLVKIKPQYGDDVNWEVGTDVSEHLGITKWEPPIKSTQGDVERDMETFHRYTSIEHWRNYPG